MSLIPMRIEPPVIVAHDVYLDGKLQKDVLIADEERGFVAKLRAEDGCPRLGSGGQVEIDTYRGEVKIVRRRR